MVEVELRHGQGTRYQYDVLVPNVVVTVAAAAGKEVQPGGTGGTGVHHGTLGGTARNPLDGRAYVQGAAAFRGEGGKGKGGLEGRCAA